MPNYKTCRYALVVSFGVVLTGVEPQDVIVRVSRVVGAYSV